MSGGKRRWDIAIIKESGGTGLSRKKDVREGIEEGRTAEGGPKRKATCKVLT